MPEHYYLADFLARRLNYGAGEHIAAFGPTSISGKSTLMFAIMQHLNAAQPEITPVTLVMKHRDRVVSGWTRRLGWQETPHWPPVRKIGNWNPPGYTLWPRQSLTDIEADNALLEREFTSAITHNRSHPPSLTFADELYGLIAELNMRKLLTAVVTRDSIAGHGLAYASQKPSGTQGISIPGFFFNSAEHMFLSKDGEERNRKRYGEIACGIDPAEIERETLRLQRHSWLYIRRSGPAWCVIDAYDPALKI